MGGLFSAPYLGEIFDNNVAVVVPKAIGDLPEFLAFCGSSSFASSVRSLDQTLKVTNRTLIKVPFDLNHWKKVAAEKYPNGLPRPHSDDPTQWLFNGHPRGAEQPLHVAVARLLGYRWPRQTGSSFPDCPALGSDGLESLTDEDGIVCLPALNREQPAAARLRSLLAAALGEGQIAGYGADVLDEEPPRPDHPLLKCRGAVITPHIGSRTYESVVRQATMAAQNMINILEGQPALAQANKL